MSWSTHFARKIKNLDEDDERGKLEEAQWSAMTQESRFRSSKMVLRVRVGGKMMKSSLPLSNSLKFRRKMRKLVG